MRLTFAQTQLRIFGLDQAIFATVGPQSLFDAAVKVTQAIETYEEQYDFLAGHSWETLVQNWSEMPSTPARTQALAQLALIQSAIQQYDVT